MGQSNWKSELSLVQEFFGQEPRFPLATEIEHQKYEFNKQNEILQSIGAEQRLSLENATHSICGSVENGFAELYKANTIGFNAINNSLEDGFSKMSESISGVNRSLENINSTLEWGFSKFINVLTITNRKLDQIIHLLNIPDNQKQRKYHVEQGFDFLKKSNFNKVFYNVSKNHFEKALEIEQSDYLCLQQLGLIHMYSLEHLDLSLSKNYLEKSITYSNAEIGFDINKENPSSFHSTFNPRIITVTSLMQLARNHYIEENFSKAISIAKQGLSISNTVGLNFDLAKYACSINDDDLAIKHLNNAIEMDRYIAVKSLTDKNLAKNHSVNLHLKSISLKANLKVLQDLEELKSVAHSNSIYKSQISKIERLTKNGNYLDSLKALEEIGYELEN